MDADGHGNASYTWRRSRMDGEAKGAIAGTSSSHDALAGTDSGKRIQVRVRFTDAAGYAEARRSAATATGFSRQVDTGKTLLREVSVNACGIVPSIVFGRESAHYGTAPGCERWRCPAHPDPGAGDVRKRLGRRGTKTAPFTSVATNAVQQRRPLDRGCVGGCAAAGAGAARVPLFRM